MTFSIIFLVLTAVLFAYRAQMVAFDRSIGESNFTKRFDTMRIVFGCLNAGLSLASAVYHPLGVYYTAFLCIFGVMSLPLLYLTRDSYKNRPEAEIGNSLILSCFFIVGGLISHMLMNHASSL